MSDAADTIFDALGEPVRRRILELLCHGPVAVGMLAAQLPIGRPAVSKHLRLLSEAGLVDHRSVGTRNLYALSPPGLVEARRWLSTTWNPAPTPAEVDVTANKTKRAAPRKSAAS
jgi:DNA-binding transcriptional ArsR family regulator